MSNSASSDNMSTSQAPLSPEKLADKAKRAEVRAYLALPRESRHRVPMSKFLDIIRTWLRVRAIDSLDRTKPIAKDMAAIDARMASYDEDDVFNMAGLTASREVDEFLAGKRDKLTQFTRIVVERILDRESYPEEWPLDRASLERFDPPYMFNGHLYSSEECRTIHAAMSAEQIVENIAKTRQAVERGMKSHPLLPELLDKVPENCTRYVTQNFTVGDALRRYVRTRETAEPSLNGSAD